MDFRNTEIIIPKVFPLYLFLSMLLFPSLVLAVINVRMQTDLGVVELELFETVAPKTVENFLNYVVAGDYDGTFIHRSSPDFVLQMGGYIFNPDQGDFFGDGTSRIPTDPPVDNEFGMSNVRGTIAMAKLSGDPDSATSEFFFNLADNSENLDNQNGGFTVFARVSDGMDVIDFIAGELRCIDYFLFNTGQCDGVISFEDSPFLDMLVDNPFSSGFANSVAPENLVKIISIGVDTDGDAVIDRIEDAGPNGGDGNNDGIADSTQGNVASLPDIRGSYVTVEADASHVLRSLSFTGGNNFLGQADPLGLLNGLNFVHGFLSFEVANVAVGGSADIRVILPEDEKPVKYFKFGPTPDISVDHLYEFEFDGETGADINGNVLTLRFVDGQRGDSDLTANGIITDPGTPALRARNSGTNGGGGCSLRSESPSLGHAGSWLLIIVLMMLLYFRNRKLQF